MCPRASEPRQGSARAEEGPGSRGLIARGESDRARGAAARRPSRPGRAQRWQRRPERPGRRGRARPPFVASREPRRRVPTPPAHVSRAAPGAHPPPTALPRRAGRESDETCVMWQETNARSEDPEEASGRESYRTFFSSPHLFYSATCGVTTRPAGLLAGAVLARVMRDHMWVVWVTRKITPERT